MYAGPLADNPVTASICFSSTWTVRPTASKNFVAISICCLVANFPLHSAVIPAPSTQGVFGIARTTGTSFSSARSIISVGTDAATEITNCFAWTCARISRATSATTCGFTQRKTMSASFTASELSVPACTFNFSFSMRARSGCATVAQVCPGESNPSRKKDCSRIDPISPTPKTATFFFELKLRTIGILPTSSNQESPDYTTRSRTTKSANWHEGSSLKPSFVVFLRVTSCPWWLRSRKLIHDLRRHHLQYLPPNWKRRRRRRRGYMQHMQKPLSLYKPEIIHQRAVRRHRLRPHP